MAENSGNQVGSAFITVSPDAKGFKAKLTSEIKDAPNSIEMAVKEMPGKGAAQVLARAREIASRKPIEAPIEAKIHTGVVRGAFDRLRLSALQAGQRSGHGFIAGFKEELGGREGFGSITKMLTTLGAGAAVGGGILKIGHLGIEQAEAIQEAKASMTAFTGSTQQAQQYINAMNAGLKGTHASVEDVANSVAVAVGTGMRSAKDVTQYTRDIANLGAAMGNNFKEAGILLDKFKAEQTVSAQGVREMEQWKIPIAAWAEKATGLSHAAFMKMVSNGQFAFQDLQNILRHNTGALAEQQAKTFKGAMASMKAQFSNAGAMLLAPVLQKAADIMNQYLVPGVTRFVNLMQRIGSTAGFKDFQHQLSSIASSIVGLIRYVINLSTVLRPIIGWVASYIWTGFLNTIRQIAALFRGLGNVFHHAGNGLRVVAVAAGLFAIRGRLIAVVARMATAALAMMGRAMMMTPWLRIPMMALAAGTAIMGFASKSRYVQSASRAISSGLSRMCSWLGVSVPQNASMSQKAMAVLGKVFDSVCSFMTTVVNVAANEIKKAFQNIVNAAIHAWNALKHIYNGMASMLNHIPGVHLGAANMTNTVEHTYQNSDDYYNAQVKAMHDRNAAYNKSTREDASPVAKITQAQTSGGGGGAPIDGDYQDGHYKLHGTGGEKNGAGGGAGGHGGSRGHGGGGGGSHGSPVDRLASAHAGTQALINKTQHLMQQEQDWEKKHNGMKNPQIMKQLIQALSDLKKALSLESSLKKTGNTHAERAEAARTSAKQAGSGGKEGGKAGEDARQVGEQMSQIGKDAVSDQFAGTPFSDPLQWKNVQSLENLLGGMGNALGGRDSLFGGLYKGMGGDKHPKGAINEHASESQGLFNARMGTAGAHLSGGAAAGKSSAAKSFNIKSGSPKEAPGQNNPFLQWGASGGGSGQGLLGGLKDATNLKNFISKDAMEKFQGQGKDGKDGKGNDVAGQKPGGNTTFNIQGANSHEVAQKVNRQHNVNRAKVHSARH